MNAVLRPAIVVVVMAPLAMCLFCIRSCRDSTDFRPIMQEVRRSEENERVQQATLRHEEGMRQVAQAYIVEAILRGQPEKLAAVLRRLEKEYQQLGAGRQKPIT